jgi:hypothetical protein
MFCVTTITGCRQRRSSSASAGAPRWAGSRGRAAAAGARRRSAASAPGRARTPPGSPRLQAQALPQAVHAAKARQAQLDRDPRPGQHQDRPKQDRASASPPHLRLLPTIPASPATDPSPRDCAPAAASQERLSPVAGRGPSGMPTSNTVRHRSEQRISIETHSRLIRYQSILSAVRLPLILCNAEVKVSGPPGTQRERSPAQGVARSRRHRTGCEGMGAGCAAQAATNSLSRASMSKAAAISAWV